MSADISNGHIPFSQREGLVPIPPQLKLGEVSGQFRRLVDFHLTQEIERNEIVVYETCSFNNKWLEIAKRIHVLFFNRNISSFVDSTYRQLEDYRRFIFNSRFFELFDFLEFLMLHRDCSFKLIAEIRDAFISERLAYRLLPDRRIGAVGTAEQAAVVERAIQHTENVGAAGAQSHLIEAGVRLRHGNWSDSVRESIHAVESVTRHLTGKDTISGSIRHLNERGSVHPALIQSISKLYAWTSDEKGVRHAKVFENAEDKLDEADALFMLGACASFVTYLLLKGE